MQAKKRRYSKEFKDGIIRLALDGNRRVADLCREHTLASSLVHGWLKQARINRGHGRPGDLTSDERAELVRLRRELKVAKMEADFLKKTAKWFAAQSM